MSKRNASISAEYPWLAAAIQLLDEQFLWRWSLAPAVVALLLGLGAAGLSKGEESHKILIVIGPSNHPPGTHEVLAGGKLVEFCLENGRGLPKIDATVVQGWPSNPADLEHVECVVFSGDRFPLAELPGTEQNMAQLGVLMDAGCGIVCFHYATGLTEGQVPINGDHPLLRWMGGYFATRCLHHQSIAKVFESAHIDLPAVGHPVLRGCQPFTVHDEPYINNYFGPNGLADNVTPLATSQLPPEAPKAEVVAWAIQRPDGGRGMGIVMPHFYKNWQVADLRKLILNGIVWSCQLDVPVEGVEVELPPLTQFGPASLDPVPRPAKK
jgi:hypothetical protein